MTQGSHFSWGRGDLYGVRCIRKTGYTEKLEINIVSSWFVVLDFCFLFSSFFLFLMWNGLQRVWAQWFNIPMQDCWKQLPHCQKVQLRFRF